jgi:group I intron endonuclease
MTELKSGIYCIENKISKKIYIGSTESFDDRKYNHFYKLENKIHANRHLQNAYNKYGKDAFNFNILEYCVVEELLIVEQKYLDTILYAQEYIRGENSLFLKIGYNLCPIAGTTSFKKHSEETVKRMSEITIGLWKDEKFRSKQMAGFTIERKQRAALKRKETINKDIEGYRLKITAPIRERMNDPEKYEKWIREVINNPERIAKSSKAMKEKWKDEEYRKSVLTPESRIKVGIGNKKKWSDPEYRKSQTEILGSPDVVEKRMRTKRATQSKEGYVNSGWKSVVAIDRKTNKVVHEFRMLKEAMEWASNQLGTKIKGEYYIKNNHKDYCGFKWMYKKDYK